MELFKPAIGPTNVTTKPEEYVGKKITFLDPELKKEKEVKITAINRILGKGSFCDWVADVSIEISDEKSDNSKMKDMAIKKYKENEKVETNILRSYDNFKTLKNLKIPTWDTYRLNIKERIVLMTLGCKENEILFTTNDVNGPKADAFIERPIKEIENMDQFVTQLKSILEILNKNSMSLNGDSWGFIFTPNNEDTDVYSISALAADIDYLNNHQNEDAEIINGYNEHNFILALHFAYPGTKEKKDAFVDYVYSKIRN